MSTGFHAHSHLTAENTGLHCSRMDYPTVLEAIMVAGGFNQTQLAERLKVTQSTVSRWLKGISRPELEQHQRIEAEYIRLGLGSVAGDVFEAESLEELLPRTVRVVGYVGAGSQPRVFYGNSQGDLDEVPAPDGSTRDTVAVEIRGDSLGSMFDRWLVFYDEVRRPVTPDLLGRLCVVGLPDESVLIKKIRKGRGGLYRLFSEREEPIENVAVEWAARVKLMVPQ